MREVAGDDDELRWCRIVGAVAGGDALHRRTQAFGRVQAVIGLARGQDMGVGQVDASKKPVMASATTHTARTPATSNAGRRPCARSSARIGWCVVTDISSSG